MEELQFPHPKEGGYGGTTFPPPSNEEGVMGERSSPNFLSNNKLDVK